MCLDDADYDEEVYNFGAAQVDDVVQLDDIGD